MDSSASDEVNNHKCTETWCDVSKVVEKEGKGKTLQALSDFCLDNDVIWHICMCKLSAQRVRYNYIQLPIDIYIPLCTKGYFTW